MRTIRETYTSKNKPVLELKSMKTKKKTPRATKEIKKTVMRSKHLKPITKEGRNMRCDKCDTPLVFWEKRYIKYTPSGNVDYGESYVEEVCKLCDKCKIVTYFKDGELVKTNY